MLLLHILSKFQIVQLISRQPYLSQKSLEFYPSPDIKTLSVTFLWAKKWNKANIREFFFRHMVSVDMFVFQYVCCYSKCTCVCHKLCIAKYILHPGWDKCFYASATKHLGIGMSVGRSVGLSVCRSVGRSVSTQLSKKFKMCSFNNTVFILILKMLLIIPTIQILSTHCVVEIILVMIQPPVWQLVVRSHWSRWQSCK